MRMKMPQPRRTHLLGHVMVVISAASTPPPTMSKVYRRIPLNVAPQKTCGAVGARLGRSVRFQRRRAWPSRMPREHGFVHPAGTSRTNLAVVPGSFGSAGALTCPAGCSPCFGIPPAVARQQLPSRTPTDTATTHLELFVWGEGGPHVRLPHILVHPRVDPADDNVEQQQENPQIRVEHAERLDHKLHERLFRHHALARHEEMLLLLVYLRAIASTPPLLACELRYVYRVCTGVDGRVIPATWFWPGLY
jgi:hypothetical protein